MLELNNSYSIFSVGDSAMTIELGTTISPRLNNLVLSVADQLTRHPFTGIKDIVSAYSSITVYYDPIQVSLKSQAVSPHQWVKERLEEACEKADPGFVPESVSHRIPVCYDPAFGTDLAELSDRLDLSIDEIVQMHLSVSYRVYMIGFLPGFPYLGELPRALTTSRKRKPALVRAGSVAIAGSQTGIYPFEGPGGWNIIGVTPFIFFNASDAVPVPLKAGDMVEFYSIKKEEYLSLVS